MHSTTYTYAPQQTERRVSLGKLSVIVMSLAMWATMIGGMAMALR